MRQQAMNRAGKLAVVVMTAGLAAGAASAQSSSNGMVMPGVHGAKTNTVKFFTPPPDASDPKFAELREWNARKVAAEKELRKIRLKHFGPIKKVEIRQAGIGKLREITDPAAFPAMLTVFEREEMDVRSAIFDHLADMKDDRGDATLAWAAVFEKDKKVRDAAAQRVTKRVKETGGEVSNSIKAVVAEGLNREDPNVNAGAGNLANLLKLYEAIPLLIQNQVRNPASGNGDDAGDLAYIYIGTQRSFIADLRPVVGQNAVAFDPVPGVLTEGVVLRVIDAFVFQYNVEVHDSLIALSSDGWGKNTAALGWDPSKWAKWYDEEFLPHRQRISDEAARKADAEERAKEKEVAGEKKKAV